MREEAFIQPRPERLVQGEFGGFAISLACAGPRAGYPYLRCVHVPDEHLPWPDGSRSDAALALWRDLLITTDLSVGTVYVGRIAGEGSHWFYFYTSDWVKFACDLIQVANRHQLKFATCGKFDPRWAYFRRLMAALERLEEPGAVHVRRPESRSSLPPRVENEMFPHRLWCSILEGQALPEQSLTGAAEATQLSAAA
jgi:hypothetical protein